MKEQYQKREQLESIIDEYQDYLFRFAYLRTGSRADAEDIVQDVLLKMFRSGNDLEKVKDMKSYLLRSISNRCKDFYKRRKPKAVEVGFAENICDESGDMDIHEEYLRIHRLLERLPESQSEVIRLKCSEKLTFAEIGKLTGATEATVKSRWRYGIQNIRKIICRD